MDDDATPLGQTAPRFFRSRVKPPTPGAIADQETAAAHGYVPPEPPPGSDPRLWCSIHHRALTITKPPERRLHCPYCLPSYQLAGSNGGRVSIRTGLRCARVTCFNIAHFDLWGVPVCSRKCADLIGQGQGRPLGCVLRVVAVPTYTDGRWIVVAFYPSGIQRGAFERRTIRLHWWVPGRWFPGSTLLRAPTCGTDVRDDRVCGYLLSRLARALTSPQRQNIFGRVQLLLADWRRGLIPPPWIETTLEPAIRHAERLLARVPGLRRAPPGRFVRAGAFRPTLKPAVEGDQDGIGGAVVFPQGYRVLRGKALLRDAKARRLPLPGEPERAAPAQRLDEDERERRRDDKAPPESEADAG